MSAATPTISVLMTSFNREAYIAEAIESVLAQTFGDFELIICDDGSTDETVTIANEYARRDARVRVTLNAENLGDYANRRRVVEFARAPFLKYHDSDDVMYAHCLAVMLEPLRREPSAAFAVSASHAWPGGPAPMLLTPRLAYEREYLGGGLFQLGPAAALFRTAQFRALGGFPDVPHAADYLFWLRACARVNVLLVPGDLFYYRVHAGQEAAKPANDLAFAQSAGVAWQMLNSSECPLTGEALALAKRNFAFVQARGMYRFVRRGKPTSALQIVRHSGLSMSDWVRYLRPPRRTRDAGTPPRAGGSVAAA